LVIIVLIDRLFLVNFTSFFFRFLGIEVRILHDLILHGSGIFRDAALTRAAFI
jgi:hypothetical protein